MRPLRLRLTLARMMMGVAILALVMGALALVLRRDRFTAKAEHFSRREFLDRLTLGEYETSLELDARMRRATPLGQRGGADARNLEMARRLFEPFQFPVDLDFLRRQAEWDSSLKDKYRRAAARPWFAVPPDPPEPALRRGPATEILRPDPPSSTIPAV